MIYIWLCNTCGTDTEVERKVADIELAPDAGCSKCGDTAHTERVIRLKKGVKGFLLEGGGWHDDCYTGTRSRN